MQTKAVLGRSQFSQAARDAARTAKRRKKEEALPFGMPQVYVIRQEDAHLQFTWEIRRFGGVVLRRSDVGFPSMALARADGRNALVKEPVS